MTEESTREKPNAVKADEILSDVINRMSDATREIETSDLSDEIFEESEEVGQKIFDLQQKIRDEFGIKEV